MIGSLLLALGDVWMLITQVFVMCLGMFVIHTLAASEVNHNARSLGGVVNGLYVSCYYAGGALGAWLMGYVYELFGWTTFVVVLSCIGMTGALCMWLYGRQWAAGR
jgi:YNFM family putative membrane transporter